MQGLTWCGVGFGGVAAIWEIDCKNFIAAVTKGESFVVSPFPPYLAQRNSVVTSILHISSSTSLEANPDTTRGGASVELRDKLERCKRQLGDWEGCPSGKTPEGKKIIENLRTQIGNMESRLMVKAEAATPSMASRQDIGGTADSATTLGSRVDVFV